MLIISCSRRWHERRSRAQSWVSNPGTGCSKAVYIARRPESRNLKFSFECSDFSSPDIFQLNAIRHQHPHPTAPLKFGTLPCFFPGKFDLINHRPLWKKCTPLCTPQWLELGKFDIHDHRPLKKLNPPWLAYSYYLIYILIIIVFTALNPVV